MTIEINIPGEPVAQARPRVTRFGAYDPSKCKAYKKTVGIIGRAAMREKEPFTGAVQVDIAICRSVPKSWSRKRHHEAVDGRTAPISRPDIDNYAKGILDGLKGVCWLDDAQVTVLNVRKIYSDTPCAKVTVLGKDEEK